MKISLLTEVSGNAIDNLGEACLGTESCQRVKFLNGGYAAHHVLEARFVSLIVGYILNWRRAFSPLLDDFSQVFNRYFFRVANVNHFTYSAVQRHQSEKSFNGVAHVAKTTGLLARSKYFNRRVG